MDKNDDLDVLFSANKSEELLPLPGQLIISPFNDDWNDFTYRIRCSYKVCLNNDNKPYKGDLFVGFSSAEDSAEFDEDDYKEVNRSLYDFLLTRNSDGFVPGSQMPQFFTMHPNMQAYRSLIQSQGLNEGRKILSTLKDIVYFKNEEPKWLGKALKSEVFKFGFMRNSEPFFAFNRAESILDGVESEDFSNISSDLKLAFKLKGFFTPHSLRLKFDSTSIIPRRIAVLIGKNGLGKSEALKSFCRGALQYSDKDLVLTDVNGKRPVISRVIAMATPGETSNTFPNERQRTQRLYYRRLNLTRKGTRSIASALVELARSKDSIGTRSRWDLFTNTLSQVLQLKNVFLKLKNKEFFPLRKLRHPGGELHSLEVWAELQEGSDPVLSAGESFYPMSSGQLTFFKFALMSCLHIENGSFVLMDEPETHMHPNMISDFVALLDEILELTGSFAMLSTHSVYFVREVSREQVHLFKEHEQGISISHPRLRTFGSDVDSISQFVFEEDIESKLTDKIFEKVKDMSFEEVKAELGAELSLAALMELQSRLEK